jgi:hypothetical protein
MTPGTNEKHYLAGALNLTTDVLHHCLGPRKTKALFRDLLTLLDHTYTTPQVTRLYVVVDNTLGCYRECSGESPRVGLTPGPEHFG